MFGHIVFMRCGVARASATTALAYGSAAGSWKCYRRLPPGVPGMTGKRETGNYFRLADNPGTTPSMDTSAFPLLIIFGLPNFVP